jgi:hypothetical protein
VPISSALLVVPDTLRGQFGEFVRLQWTLERRPYQKKHTLLLTGRLPVANIKNEMEDDDQIVS